MDRPSRQKVNKETQALNYTLDQMDVIDIYRAFHPRAAENTFFSSAHRTFSRTDHTLGDKSSLGKFKKIEILSSICLFLSLLFILGFFGLFVFICFLPALFLFVPPPFFARPCVLWGIHSQARGQTWASGVGMPSPGFGNTREFPPQGILNGKSSPGCLHLNSKTWLHPTACRVQCWMPHTKQQARQEHKPTHQQTGCLKSH